jgi:hypothetical protein
MITLPDNAAELAILARDLGAEVLTGHLRYPSETGGWQLGDLDFDEHLAHFRDQPCVVIIAPIGPPEPATYRCGICGFVMQRPAPCPRCARQVAELAAELAGEMTETGEGRDVLDQVAELLDGEDADDDLESPLGRV